jgi:hypothetical protein
MLRGRLYLVIFILISISLVFIPVVDLQGNQNPNHHQYYLPNGIPHVFKRLVVARHFFGGLSWKKLIIGRKWLVGLPKVLNYLEKYSGGSIAVAVKTLISI